MLTNFKVKLDHYKRIKIINKNMKKEKSKEDFDKIDIVNGNSITSEDNDLKGMLKESLEWSKKVYEQNNKIYRRLRWMVWGNYLKLFIIITPIIIGIIYLPPYLAEIWESYKNILGISTNIPANSLSDIQASGDLMGILDLLK